MVATVEASFNEELSIESWMTVPFETSFVEELRQVIIDFCFSYIQHKRILA